MSKPLAEEFGNMQMNARDCMKNIFLSSKSEAEKAIFLDPTKGTSLFTTNAKVQAHNNKAMKILWDDGKQILRLDA